MWSNIKPIIIKLLKLLLKYLFNYALIIILGYMTGVNELGSANAESDNEDEADSAARDKGKGKAESPEELDDDKPKRDKGKGRAVTPEELEDDKPKRDKGKGRAVYYDDFVPIDESESSYDEYLSYKQEQELYDSELARKLQNEEWDLEEEYQESFSLNDKYVSAGKAPSETSSEYTVLSSEIHSDDSEITKTKKLQIKEVEKGLKRNYDEASEPDVDLESKRPKK